MLRILKVLEDIFAAAAFAEAGEYYRVRKDEPGFDVWDENQALSDGRSDGVAG